MKDSVIIQFPGDAKLERVYSIGGFRPGKLELHETCKICGKKMAGSRKIQVNLTTGEWVHSSHLKAKPCSSKPLPAPDARA